MTDVLTDLYEKEVKRLHDASLYDGAHFALVDMGVVNGTRTPEEIEADETVLNKLAMKLHKKLLNDGTLFTQEYAKQGFSEAKCSGYVFSCAYELEQLVQDAFSTTPRYEGGKVTVTTDFTIKGAISKLTYKTPKTSQFFVWYAWDESDDRLGMYGSVSVERVLQRALSRK